MPPNSEEVDHHKLAQSLYDQLKYALGIHYVGNLEIQEEYCKKYAIEKNYELPALTNAFNRRLRQMHRDSQDETLRSVEERIKRKHFSDFIEEHFKGCTGEEAKYLFSTMDAEFKDEDYSDWGHCLQTFLKLGLNGVRKQRSTETRRRRIKNCLRAIWMTLKGVLQIGIVWAAYSILQTPFETLVVSILLVIYSVVALHASASAVRWTSDTIKADSQFSDLRSVLGKPLAGYVLEPPLRMSKDLETQQVAVLIYQFTIGAVDLIALWKVIHVIGWL